MAQRPRGLREFTEAWRRVGRSATAIGFGKARAISHVHDVCRPVARREVQTCDARAERHRGVVSVSVSVGVRECRHRCVAGVGSGATYAT